MVLWDQCTSHSPFSPFLSFFQGIINPRTPLPGMQSPISCAGSFQCFAATHAGYVCVCVCTCVSAYMHPLTISHTLHIPRNSVFCRLSLQETQNNQAFLSSLETTLPHLSSDRMRLRGRTSTNSWRNSELRKVWRKDRQFGSNKLIQS